MSTTLHSSPPAGIASTGGSDDTPNAEKERSDIQVPHLLLPERSVTEVTGMRKVMFLSDFRSEREWRTCEKPWRSCQVPLTDLCQEKENEVEVTFPSAWPASDEACAARGASALVPVRRVNF